MQDIVILFHCEIHGCDAVDEYCKGNVETFGAFAAENGLNDKPVIALLAGSRKQEIKDNLPKMLEAAASFTKDYQWCLPVHRAWNLLIIQDT